MKPAPRETLRLRLQALACDALVRIRHVASDPVSVSADNGAATLTLTLTPGVEPVATEAPVPSFLPFLLDPLDVQILQCVVAGPMKGGNIGKRLGMTEANGQATPRLRILLSRLVACGILENGDDGYYLSSAFCALVPHIPQLATTSRQQRGA